MSSANGMDAASTVIGYSTQLTPAGNVTCEGHEIPAASVVAVLGGVGPPLAVVRAFLTGLVVGASGLIVFFVKLGCLARELFVVFVEWVLDPCFLVDERAGFATTAKTI